MLGCAFIVRGIMNVMGSCRRCRSSTVVIWSLSVLPCRALSYLGGGFHLALRARAPTVGALGAPPVPSPLVGSGVPPSPPRLGCSLRSHRPTARAALAHRYQPMAGVFVGWRSAANMAVVAIAQGLRRLLLGRWGRVLCILLARDSCCASAGLPLGRSHQLPGRTLNGA